MPLKFRPHEAEILSAEIRQEIDLPWPGMTGKREARGKIWRLLVTPVNINDFRDFILVMGFLSTVTGLGFTVAKRGSPPQYVIGMSNNGVGVDMSIDPETGGLASVMLSKDFSFASLPSFTPRHLKIICPPPPADRGPRPKEL